MHHRYFVVRHLKGGVENKTYATGPTWYLVVEKARAIFGTSYMDVSEEIEPVDDSLVTLHLGA